METTTSPESIVADDEGRRRASAGGSDSRLSQAQPRAVGTSAITVDVKGQRPSITATVLLHLSLAVAETL